MVADVTSRRLVRRWAATSDDEARAYLQVRLVLLLTYLFWAIAALIVVLEIQYTIYPSIEPRNNTWVMLIGTSSLVIMGGLRRKLLTQPARSARVLHAVDALYTIGSGVLFGAAALLAYDFRPAGYTSLMYECFALLTRALIVPSTGRRTAILTSLAFVPMVIAATLLTQWREQEIPGPEYVAGGLVVAIVIVLLCAAGSRIIYDLKHAADAAQQLGQYKLVRKIGEGGLGVVYLAQHVLLRRPTAIKQLLPERVGADNLERFEREVHHTSQLTHPNTVAVYDFGRGSDGTFYYAMEYLGGGIDLEQLVRIYGPQPAARVVPILVQVCGALQEAHDMGIIHRDIKPANIMLCERGGLPDVAKVVDFGLVKEITAEAGDSQQILGTPAYLAPEAVNDPHTIGPAVDLYALGCVGYFLLTGRMVFEGKTSIAICIQHVSDAPMPPSRLVAMPAELEAVILRCLAKAPADRYASADALAEALAAVPISGWREADAHRWWKNVRPSSEVAHSSSPTAAITIDLGRRIEVQR